MSSSAVITESMGWKLHSFLEKFPHFYDIAFLVGPKKVLVKALSIILRASSPVLEKEFKDGWEGAVGPEGEGVLLPDFDPVAFKLFLKLMILDTWSVASLKALKLPLHQLLHLLVIYRKYEIKTAVRSLTELLTDSLKNFHKYVVTKDSLLLSHSQLETVLESNELLMNELEVFNYACRWAEEQCRKQELEVTGTNLRLVLGDAIYKIRFPQMMVDEFARVMEIKGLLETEEVTEIVQCIGMQGSRHSNDTNKYKFQMEKRNKPEFTSVPPGSSIVSAARVFPIVDTPFVCNGKSKRINFNLDMKIMLRGLGFVGPIDADCFYDVTAQIVKWNPNPFWSLTVKLEKRIWAEKCKTFYFVFDQPVLLHPIPYDDWNNCYRILFSLKGPNTRSLQYEPGVTKRINDGSKEFVVRWWVPQLLELVYDTI